MNVAIYIYENAEVLDFSGPFEVFSTANRFIPPKSAFNVFLIAQNLKPVLARGAYSVNPNFDFDEHPDIDVLIVVGGIHTGELEKTEVLEWIAATSQKAGLVASVCTGAFILAEAGVLKEVKVTTHWEDIQALRENYPLLTVIENTRWVDEGKFVTSGGISAGIDMSLHLVARLLSASTAEQTAKQMEFDWRKNG